MIYPTMVMHVHDLYYILMRKTAKGTALTTVLQQKDTQDGALAWKGLRDYWSDLVTAL